MTATALYHGIARLLLVLIAGIVVVVTAVSVASAITHHASGDKAAAMIAPRPICRGC